jgi:hypothetical protein
MGSFSIWHWLIVLIVALILSAPGTFIPPACKSLAFCANVLIELATSASFVLPVIPTKPSFVFKILFILCSTQQLNK